MRALYPVVFLFMSGRGTDQPAEASASSRLFHSLFGRAFEHFAAAAPTVLRANSDEQGFGLADFPTWPAREVASAADLPVAASELLSSGPVLLLPPWRRLEDPRDDISRHEYELVLIDCVPPGPGALLAAVVPAKTMVTRVSERFRKALALHWQPVLVQYTRGGIHGVDRRFETAAVFLRARADGEAPPLRMFKYSADDDESAVLDDFDRLLARQGGRGRFGYVVRDVPKPGETLGFARHDPQLKARRDALSGFGGATTLQEVFETPTPGYDPIESRELLCGADEPGAVRIISGRDIKRDGTIGLPDERTEWALVPLDQQLRVGDIVLQTIIHLTDRPRPCRSRGDQRGSSSGRRL
ncbi:hypothetical protein [Actinocrispum sp. NPDC049592]|uniref:hypothetical protein n=1 Tax=Actinocrispum sp. NPDC049592 TaxID=3154835 RepID=UPI0034162F71